MCSGPEEPRIEGSWAFVSLDSRLESNNEEGEKNGCTPEAPVVFQLIEHAVFELIEFLIDWVFRLIKYAIDQVFELINCSSI